MAAKNQSEMRGSCCFLSLLDKEDLTRRLVQVSDIVAQAVRHRQFLESCLRDLSKDRRKARLSRQAADQAYALEQSVRIAIKIGIDTLNELADSGFLDALSSAASVSPQRGGGFFPPANGWTKISQDLRQNIPGLNPCLFDEIEGFWSKYEINVKQANDRKGSWPIEFVTARGERQEIAIDHKRRPGALGRVVAADIFSTNPERRIGLALPLPILPTCHAAQMRPAMGNERAQDLYGATVATFILAKDMAYRHARQVDELGLTEFSGGDFGLLGLLILLVILLAIGLTVASVVYGIECAEEGFSVSKHDCQMAFNLLLGGGVLSGIAIGATGGNVRASIQAGLTISVA